MPSSPISIEMSLPLCAALSQLVISFKTAIWLRITMSGFVISTSTSGFDTWLASPLPMTTDSYLWKKESLLVRMSVYLLIYWIQILNAWNAHLLFAVPFQHSSPAAIFSPAHTVSGKVDQNFFACFNFFFTSLVCLWNTQKKSDTAKRTHKPGCALGCLRTYQPI